MKIAITDACIFIDLFELNLIKSFFGVNIEAHTSVEVFNELDPHQQRELQPFILNHQLTVHSLTGEEITAMNVAGYTKALSNSDKSVLFLAEQLDAILLSSDKAVRNAAKNKEIEVHGMLWILEKLKDQNIIPAEIAIEKMQALMEFKFYKYNLPLVAAMKNILSDWGVKD